ncbi:MAG: phosphoglycolate phosphatase [Burkholderia sp.]
MGTSIHFASPRLAAALIDLDGTMIDTVDDFTAALNAMLARIGAPGTQRNEVMHYVGKGSENLIGQVLKPRLVEADAQARFDEALAIYQAEYATINGRHTRLYPDVEVGLAAMREVGLALACVTNKPHRFALDLLAQYRLDGYFSVVLGGDSLPRKKPDPLPMLTACQRLGVEPAVAIGDSENDALAGRAAGLATLTVPYGYNHGKAIQTINSDGIVDSLLVAAQVITAHNAAERTLWFILPSACF